MNPLTLTIWAVSSLVATLAGPFGTFSTMPPVDRAVFWAGLIAASQILSLALASIATVTASTMRPLLRDGAVVVVFSLLFTPIVVGAVRWYDGGELAEGLSVVRLGLWVAAIAAAVSLFLRQVRRHVPELGVTAPMAAANTNMTRDPEPRLLRRMEGVTLGEVVRLTVEDHYVVVILSDRSERRLLMRFGDAVDEMECAKGYCVHRSHWVMASAIEGVAKFGGREMAILTNGDYVPVSRTYRQNLVDAGFLQPAQEEATV